MRSPRANIIVFWTVQAAALLVFVVPFSWDLAALCAATYLLRMAGVTLAFHRHFAHRAFEPSRPVRFLFALLGTAAMQKGPLWWAGNHVYHHRFADREGDPHSPKRLGFYQAHIGWFLDDVRHDRVHADNPVMRAFAHLSEIRWLDRFYGLPPLGLAAACLGLGGLPALVWGFCLSTTLLAHATFSINTINHLYGPRRFRTSDDSRHDPWTALLTLGEGWHNNHHRYPRAARNGFYWWELDLTFAILRVLQALGSASRMVEVPDHVYHEAREKRPDTVLSVAALRGVPEVEV
jgi:stearoyl-CoA desaturase (delta-9 desaturase)